MLLASALLALATLTSAADPARVAPDSGAVATAMADAVRQRLGAATEVEITDVTVAATVPIGRLAAVPDAGSRSGGRVGFSLVITSLSHDRPRTARVGRASATVRVWLEQVRTSRFVARGMALSIDDLEPGRAEGVAIPLRRLPTLVEVLGGRALRDLAAGDSVTIGSVVLQPVVRAGDEVLVTAAGRDFQVTATMKAVDSGAAGAVIRVINRDSRRIVRARIVSKGMVDILND